MNNKFLNKINLFLLFSILLLAGAAQQTLAVTRTVTKIADTNDAVCNADCSLREAVAVAQDGDDIRFLSNLAGGTITLSSSISVSKSIAIVGIDNLKISGGGLVSIFRVMNKAHLTLRNLDLGWGYMDDRLQPWVGVGGAIAVYWSSLTVDDCYIHNSKAFTTGGAIWAVGSVVSIQNSLIAANKANSGGGGISIQSSRLGISNTKFNLNTAGFNGGAAWISDSSMRMNDTSIYKNSSAANGGALYLTEANAEGYYSISNSAIHNNGAQNGGGIYNDAALYLINSTVSTNYANAGNGGGLSNHDTALLRNVTVTLNNASGDAGGIDSVTGDVDFGNTIVAGNTSVNNFSPNMKGDVTSAGFNVIGPSAGAVFWGDQTGNQFNVFDPMLNPLAFNGSVTLNHYPKAGSPVIDAGSDALATDQFGNMLPIDQRGFNRIFGGVVDVGAVEVSN